MQLMFSKLSIYPKYISDISIYKDIMFNIKIFIYRNIIKNGKDKEMHPKIKLNKINIK